MDRSSSWTNAGRNTDYIPPSRVAKMATPSPRSPPGSTAEAVATARRAEYGTGGSILPVLPTVSSNAYKRTSWTTPRSPSSCTLEDEFQQPSNDAVTSSPRRAEMAAAKRAEPGRQRFVSDGLFASDTEQAQLQYMEQMYGTINLLNAELENERRNRAALEAAARPATYSSSTDYSSLGDTVGEFDEPSGYLVTQTPVAPSYSPRKLRTMPSPPSQPPQTQHRVARPPVSPRSVVKDQDHELCATLGKNAELRIRSRDMERTVEKTELELELARKQIKMAERRAESREEKLRALLKEKLSWQKELKATRAQVVEEKMRQVDLFREVEAAKRHFAAELEAAEQELQAVQGENTQLRTHAAEMKAQMNFQARKMEDMARQAQDEKARFVSMIEDTRHRFHEWKEGEADALAAAHDQAVRNLKTEYELKMERHQDEKQKLRDKVNDLEVSMRLLQKDRALSPLELSLRKTAILGSENTGTIEAEQIEAQSRILELENLLAHSQQYQARQESIIKLSESTISRLMQEREVTALENLSLHPFGVEPQRSEDLSYNTQLTGYVVAPSIPTRRVTPPGTPSRGQQSPVTSNEPPIARSPRSRSHTPRRADLEASIAQAAQADNTKKQAANTENNEPSSKEQSLMDELAQLRKALVEAQAKAEAHTKTLKSEVKDAEQEPVEVAVGSIGLAVEGHEVHPSEADVTSFDTLESPDTDATSDESETPAELKAEVDVEEVPGTENKTICADSLDDSVAPNLIDNVPSEPPPTEINSWQNTSEEQQFDDAVELKELMEKCDAVQGKLDGVVTTTSDEQEIHVQEVSSDVNEWVDVSTMSDEPDAPENEPHQDNRSNVGVEESRTDPNETKFVDNDVPIDSEGTTERIENPSPSPECKTESTRASDDEITQSHDEKDVIADVSAELKPSGDFESEGNSDFKADEKEIIPAVDDDVKLSEVFAATLPNYNNINSGEKEEPCEIAESTIENLETDSDKKVASTLIAEDVNFSEDLDSKVQDIDNVVSEEKGGVKDGNLDVEEKEAIVNDFVVSAGSTEQIDAVEISSAIGEIDEVMQTEEPPETNENDSYPDMEEHIEASTELLSQVEEIETPLVLAGVSTESEQVDDISTAEVFAPEVKEVAALDETDISPEISINSVESEVKFTESPSDNEAGEIEGTEEAPDKCMYLQDIEIDNVSAGETEADVDCPMTVKNIEHVNDEAAREAPLDEDEVLMKPSLEADVSLIESKEIQDTAADCVSLEEKKIENDYTAKAETIESVDDEAVIEIPLDEDEARMKLSEETNVLLVESKEVHEEFTVKPQLQPEEPAVSSCDAAMTPATDTEVETPEASTAKVFVALVEITGLSVVVSLLATSSTISSLERVEDLSPPDVNAVEADAIPRVADDIPAEMKEAGIDMVSDSASELPLPLVVGDDSLSRTNTNVPGVDAIIETEVGVTRECDVIITSEADADDFEATDVSTTENDDVYSTKEEQQPFEGNNFSAPMEIAIETIEDDVALLTKAIAENFVKELMETLDPTALYNQNHGANEALLDSNTPSVPDTVGLSTTNDIPAEEATVEFNTPPSDFVDGMKDTLDVEAVCSSFQSATEEHVLPVDETTASDTLTVARTFVTTIASEAISSVLLSLQTETHSDDTILSTEQEQEGFESDSTRSIIESGYVSSDEQNDPEIFTSEPDAEEETNTSTSLTDDSSEELTIVGGDDSESALEIAGVVHDCVGSVEREVITTLNEIESNSDEATIVLNELSTTELITDVSCIFTSHAIAEALHRLTDCAVADSGNPGISCDDGVELGEFLPVGEVGSEASAVGSSEETTVIPEVVDTQIPEEHNDNDDQWKTSQEEAQISCEQVEEDLESEVALAVYDITKAVVLGQTEAVRECGIIDALANTEVNGVDIKASTASNVDIDIGGQTTDLQNGNDDGVIALVLTEVIDRIRMDESNQDDICGSPINDIVLATSASALGEHVGLEVAKPLAACDKVSDVIDSDDCIAVVVEGIVSTIESCDSLEPETGSDCSNSPVGKKEAPIPTDQPSDKSTASGSLPYLASANAKDESIDAATEDTKMSTLEGEASEELGTADTKMEDPNKHGDIEAYAVRSFGFSLTDVEHLVRLTLDSLVDAVAGHSVNEPSRRSSIPDEFDSLESEVENVVANLCVSADYKIGSRHGRARSVHFSSDTTDEKSDRMKQERRSVLLWKSPVDTACNKESVESSAKRRASRRRVSRRTLADLLTFPNEMSRFSSSDTTLLAYDARQEQGPIFSLMDQSILTINPNGQHIDLDDSEERVASKIIGKRKTLMQELHSKNLALRQIPRFNYMPMRIKFQWSDFVVATPVRPTNMNFGEGHVDKCPVEPMRLLQKRGAKLPCGTYVVVSAFIRPLEDGNENLRVEIYDGERVEEFQFDFSEDFMKKYHLETSGLEAQSLEFLGHLEFRRDEDTIIIKLPERKAGEGDKTDVDRIQSERTMIGGGDSQRREPVSKHSKMAAYRRPASSPTVRSNSEISPPREPTSSPSNLQPASAEIPLDETFNVEESEIGVHM
ncbi:hypothetical protein P3T76_010156 [Phytophthora citrophthora]|uniref:Uncharacterized protein n=1 Tax=Phytophthora citrophthora TaxID=4793 RepID=A0AAD9GEG5_9STRA|nr:hypothetical protein P3T76_010156 [Phytophthora citrophthora]